MIIEAMSRIFVVVSVLFILGSNGVLEKQVLAFVIPVILVLWILEPLKKYDKNLLGIAQFLTIVLAIGSSLYYMTGKPDTPYIVYAILFFVVSYFNSIKCFKGLSKDAKKLKKDVKKNKKKSKIIPPTKVGGF